MKKFVATLLALAMLMTLVPLGAVSVSAENYYRNLTYTINDGEITITDCETWASGMLAIPDKIEGYPVTKIGEDAFYACEYLTSVTIPDSVTSIGAGAFCYCPALTSMTIPDGVISIGAEAFKACNIISVTIPKSVTSIGAGAFSSCTGLRSVYISDIAAWCAIDFDGHFSTPLYYADKLYLNGTLVTDLVIPDSVTSIGDFAFYENGSLTSVTIPESVTSIGDYAFCGCNALTSVTIPDSVTSIGDDAFCGCNALTLVTIPDSVTSIGESAFYGCTKLTSVNIPGSVTTISERAFLECPALTTVTIQDGVTSIGDYAFYGCRKLTSVTFPDSVTSIGENAFRNCWQLTSVTIPDSVTSIGDYAFCYCKSLELVTISGCATSIGDYAFSDCISLINLTILDGVTTIGEKAFYNCTRLGAVVIPDSVTAIGAQAFYNCTSIRSVYYTGTQADFSKYYYVCDGSLAFATWHYNVIVLNGHVYINSCDSDCDLCGEIRTDAHNYIAVVTDPDCVNGGYTTYTCSDCGDRYVVDEVAALGHDYKGVVTVPTCTQDGDTTYTCSKCGDRYVVDEVAALGHDYKGVVTAPTCTAYGYTTYTCSVCGDTYVANHTEMMAHAYDHACDTSCNSCGYQRFETPNHAYTHILCDKDCDICGAVRIPPHFYTDDCDIDCNLCEEIRKVTHAFDNDCDEYCNVCGDYREVPDHVYSHRCDRDCNVCYAIRTVTHSYSNKCDNTCNYCGAKRKVAAHTYKLVVTKKATATANGYSLKTCTECGETEGDKVTIYKIGHVKLSKTSYTYNGKVQKPSVSVKDSMGNTISGSHYTVTYPSGCKNAGTYKVAVKFKGNYSGTKTLIYTIKGIDVSKCKISLSTTSYTYDGKVKKPSVTVKNHNGTKLTTSHYTVTYASGRKNPGTYKVTIKMKGNYSGTMTLTFKIIPAKTSISKLTGASKKLTVKWSKKTTQVTGYEIQYATAKSFKSAKTKTVTKNSTVSTTLTGLKAKTTYYVRIRTYKTVNGKKIYSGWSTVKVVKTK